MQHTDCILVVFRGTGTCSIDCDVTPQKKYIGELCTNLHFSLLRLVKKVHFYSINYENLSKIPIFQHDCKKRENRDQKNSHLVFNLKKHFLVFLIFSSPSFSSFLLLLSLLEYTSFYPLRRKDPESGLLTAGNRMDRIQSCVQNNREKEEGCEQQIIGLLPVL